MEKMLLEQFNSIVSFKRIGKDLFAKNISLLTKSLLADGESDIDVIIDTILSKLSVDFEFDPSELKNIESDQPVIFISNYTFGGLEELILYRVISKYKKDVKVWGNSVLIKQEVFAPVFINKFETVQLKDLASFSNRYSNHLKEGKSLIVFPATKASPYLMAKKDL
ncbi:MAG: hypothetical protein IPO21_12720 [Bacteroidales bacterium]|nr:hypothetical protein [Bacteroidales bacterium]